MKLYPFGWAYHDTSNALTLNAEVKRQWWQEVRPGCDLCHGRNLQSMMVAYGYMLLCTRHAEPVAEDRTDA